MRAAIAYLSGQVERGREACRRAESERVKLLAERSSLRDSLDAAERRVHELQCETRHLRGSGSASGAGALGLASPNVLESSPALSPNRMPSPILQLTPLGIFDTILLLYQYEHSFIVICFSYVCCSSSMHTNT